MKFLTQIGLVLILAAGWLSLAHAADQGPRMVVEQAANEVLAILKKDGDKIRNNHDEIVNLANDLILPLFDFDKMSYFVLGTSWTQATAQQKQDFQREFKRLLIATYTKAISEFSDDREIIYKDTVVSPKNPSIAMVPSEIRQKGGEPIQVAYRMFQTESQWRIYDVVIDGVSLVTNYRANFAGQVRSNGLDGLIASMSKHNQPQSQVNATTIQPASQTN
jgi:phospholipid transport system substrate-binding protein